MYKGPRYSSVLGNERARWQVAWGWILVILMIMAARSYISGQKAKSLTILTQCGIGISVTDPGPSMDIAILDSNDSMRHLQLAGICNGVVHISSGSSDRLSLDAGSGNVIISNIPTSSAGLTTGTLYSIAGVVHIV